MVDKRLRHTFETRRQTNERRTIPSHRIELTAVATSQLPSRFVNVHFVGLSVPFSNSSTAKVQGSHTDTLVVLARLFSNSTPSPLKRALSAYGNLGRQAPFDRRLLQPIQRSVRLNDVQVKRLAEGYREGETAYELAGRFGVDRRTVSTRLKEYGVWLRRQSPTDAMVGDMIRLYASGLSAEQTAERVGVSADTVLNHLRASGVNRRAPGRPHKTLE